MRHLLRPVLCLNVCLFHWIKLCIQPPFWFKFKSFKTPNQLKQYAGTCIFLHKKLFNNTILYRDKIELNIVYLCILAILYCICIVCSHLSIALMLKEYLQRKIFKISLILVGYESVRFLFFKSALLLRASPSWYDGYSVFFVGTDNKIYKHVADKVDNNTNT